MKATMKLSEAIMLGSTVIKLDPGCWLIDGKRGCLCGMAYFAATGKRDASYEQVVKFWPWLQKTELIPPRWATRNRGEQRSAAAVISDIALDVCDGHVPLEKAVAWIETQEPVPAVRKARARKKKELVEV